MNQLNLGANRTCHCTNRGCYSCVSNFKWPKLSGHYSDQCQTLSEHCCGLCLEFGHTEKLQYSHRGHYSNALHSTLPYQRLRENSRSAFLVHFCDYRDSLTRNPDHLTVIACRKLSLFIRHVSSITCKAGTSRGSAHLCPNRKFSCCCHTGRKWLPLRLFFNEDTDISISFRFLALELQSTAMQPRRQVHPVR